MQSIVAADSAARDLDVFIVYGCEQSKSLVNHLHRRFQEVSATLQVDTFTLASADAEPAAIPAQCWGATVGVILLTERFMRTVPCMVQLHSLLGRSSSHQSPGSIPDTQLSTPGRRPQLAVVLDGLTVDQLKLVLAQFGFEKWWSPAPKPADDVRAEWVDNLKAVITDAKNLIHQQAAWQEQRQVADLAVQRVLELLEDAGNTAWKAGYVAAQAAAIREWERQADELMPGAPPSDIATPIDKQSTPPDVFLSHPGELKLTVVDVIHKAFKDKQPHLVVFLDEQSVDPGMRALHAIGQACRTASIGVLVLSPEFVRKKYCMAELTIFLRRKGEVQLLPLLHGLTVEDLSDMRRVYASQEWCVAAAMPEGRVLDAWAADLNALTDICMIRSDQWRGYGQLVELVVASTAKLLEAAGKLPEMSGMVLHNHATPAAATVLVGRQEELQGGLQALTKWRYLEIRGGPGEGKSTLAQHVVQALCDEWQRLPRVEAAGTVAYILEVDLRDVGGGADLKRGVAEYLLSLVSVEAQGAAWGVLLGWLRRHEVGRTVILLENAEEGVPLEDLQPLLETLRALPTVHLIVATRVAGPPIKQVPPEEAVVELQPLGEPDGMRLVEAHLGPGHAWGADGKDKEAAGQLVQLAGSNPLVLSVAAGLVRSKQLSWQVVAQKARQAYAAINPRMRNKAGGMRAYMGALQHWLCSCLAEEERQFLAVLSVFAGSFTAAGAADIGGIDDEDMLLALQDASLLQQRTVRGISSKDPDQAAERFIMHALVREAAAQLHPGGAGKQLCVQQFTKWMLLSPAGPGQALLRCKPEGEAPDTAHRLYLLHEELQNYAAAAKGLLALQSEEVEEVLGAAVEVGEVLSECGHVHAAKALHQCAVEVAERVFGAEAAATLQAKSGLASTLEDMGKLPDAERLWQELVEAYSQTLGPFHTSTLKAKNNLSITLCTLGKAGDARQLQEELLEARTQLLGPEHPDTVASKSNLAAILNAMDKRAEARRLFEEVLEEHKRIWGLGHPHTVSSEANLASVLMKMGELREARRMLEAASAQRAEVLGPQHPATLSAKGNLAMTLRAMGELGEAMQLQEEVLEAQMKALGADHPSTLTAKRELGATLNAMGEREGARVLQQEVVEASARILGSEHPDIFHAKNSLIVTLYAMGELVEARKLQEELLESCTLVLGPEHSVTLTSKGNLAGILNGLGELADAKQLQEEVLEAQTQQLGPEHPATVTTRGNLAGTLHAMGELDEARQLQEEVLEARTRSLGAEHPDTLSTKYRLAVMLNDLGEVADARRLQQEVLEARRRVLGPEHPDTRTVEQSLSST